MKKNRGSNLVEYVVPTAIVGIIIAIGLYNMIQNGSLLNFLASSANMKVDKSNGMLIAGKSSSTSTSGIKPGSLNGTTENPTSACKDGVCAVDYGSFVLTGIPEDFGSYVQTHGASGGTDSLSNIINQLATQLEADGNIAGSTKFKDLANLGHYTSTLEKMLEDSASYCVNNNPEDVFNCSRDTSFSNALNIPVPENLQSIITQPPSHNLAEYTSDFQMAFSVGWARYIKTSEPLQNFEDRSAVYPAFAFVKTYDSIMEDQTISQAYKNITTELFLQYAQNTVASGTLAEGIVNGGTVSTQIYNPVTGEITDNVQYTIDPTKVQETFINPQYAQGTNVLSALKCAVGHNYDTGTSCI